MTLNHRSTSADIALHTYGARHNTLDSIDEWKRGAPDDTQEFSSGPWKYSPRKPRRDPEGRAPEGSFIFASALIVCIAAAASFAIWFL